MEKITGKKFALNNSYFKNIRFVENAPKTPKEVFEYYKEFKEFPFKDIDLKEEEILFEIFGEYNKMVKVQNDQFFTPPITADRMAYLLDEFAKKIDDERDEYTKHTEPLRVLDICCGYGQLTYAVEKFGFLVSGVDLDTDLCELYEEFTNSGSDSMNFQDLTEKRDLVISNPPYSIPILTEFLEKLHEILNGYAVILVPKGFFEKTRPKKLIEILNKFEILHREDMEEEFKNTKIRAEILVLKVK